MKHAVLSLLAATLLLVHVTAKPAPRFDFGYEALTTNPDYRPAGYQPPAGTYDKTAGENYAEYEPLTMDPYARPYQKPERVHVPYEKPAAWEFYGETAEPKYK